MPVTPEEVIWAYRMILGREPENESVIKKLATTENISRLREMFLRSAEFQALQAQSWLAAPTSFVSERPLGPVDITGKDADMAKLWSHVKESWEVMGRDIPYHSVVTAQDYLPENFKNNEEAFWVSGVFDRRRIVDICASCGIDLGGLNSCLEYGCGVGRASLQIADLFDHLWCVDISKPHLQIAERQAQIRKINNINFTHIGLDFFSAMPKYDFFYSRIVLQHNPPPVMYNILSILMKNLPLGGAAVFQIPVYMSGYSFNLKEYLEEREPAMEMHCLPQPEIIKLVQEMGCAIQEIREDGDIGNFGDWVSNTFAISK